MKIFVTGATGSQGGAVLRALLKQNFSVRAFTRNPKSNKARELADLGAEIVQGDLDDLFSIQKAMEGVQGVFSVQNFWEHGFDSEVRQGKALADAALAAGIKHFVYSSVGGAERNTGIAHFESKWEIEKHIRGSKLPATIIRPVFFMDNFLKPYLLKPIVDEGKLPLALSPSKALQMIAVSDIGAIAAIIFQRSGEFLGKALEIAGDELTMPEVAELLSAKIGKPIVFQEIPVHELEKQSVELSQMYGWFNKEGYQADIPQLRKLHQNLLTFKNWLDSYWL